MLTKPRVLLPGATVGIAAPGGPVDPDRVEVGRALLEKAGFATWCRDDLIARSGYLAGDDDRRIDELMQLVCDPKIDAIVCARGGYGCDRILDRLDPEAFRAAAKPLVGYSDITALHLWQARQAGLAGIHGPMLEQGDGLDEVALQTLTEMLTGQAKLPMVLRGSGLVEGTAEGALVGGSLTMLAASIGTSWEVDTAGAILLLEDVGEPPYRIDRMLQQLRGARKLEGVVGVGFGDFSTCLDDRYGSRIDDVLADWIRPLGVPCVTSLPFGHVRFNHPWPVGGRATLDGASGEVHIVEQGVRIVG
ncbi:MAG: LD-carboxypeptidase [Deltaproteobacteria bacterium]|nr:LD-carboxypeptidase [Myxococcales bacterium]TDJ10342.1 MAG: LD-carboxypeptidase [Deltaproteobacteria bacterium]TDJ19893.1 MAG: LD-carboxypeptidase [Deltaproteobacteria bacterium]